MNTGFIAKSFCEDIISHNDSKVNCYFVFVIVPILFNAYINFIYSIVKKLKFQVEKGAAKKKRF